ncbi:MAG: hypothetical protein E6053_01695 [Finegoldia magna]|uniref:hypothetical protein n=1 Tax=Finegoldia magna TaxID=1260 RepID=UPI00291040E0|nr:hypothetical protein [Finegoldia magna]MDU5272988.1 hypothetical protein [Finegoldia magna]MDU5526169.1 hypothetical protein [Finegoldia magna]MDU5925119.1 hypothetical protein [Finegoldia magna]MDU7033023.1 hypothetical protein [Finegoldia magna]
MKLLMDGRNHGAGTSTSKPCGVVVNGCVIKTCIHGNSCNGTLIIYNCQGAKTSGYNPRTSSNV